MSGLSPYICIIVVKKSCQFAPPVFPIIAKPPKHPSNSGKPEILIPKPGTKTAP